MDKSIKRTRMQWKRSQDASKPLESREVNRKKAEKNMLFLRSIGVGVELDAKDGSKLVVKKREIA